MAIGAMEAVFGRALDRSGQHALVRLLPPLRRIGQHVVVRLADDAVAVQVVVAQPAIAGLQVPHVLVEHRDCRRRVPDERAQPILARAQRFFDGGEPARGQLGEPRLEAGIHRRRQLSLIQINRPDREESRAGRNRLCSSALEVCRQLRTSMVKPPGAVK